MASVNKVIIVGNLGRDPEIRYMPSGDAIANIAVATSYKSKDRNTGEQKEQTEWHKIVVWGKQAEIVEKYFQKGDLILLEGKLQTREWEKDGVKRYTTEIVVDMQGTMQLLGGKPEGQQQAPRQQAPQQSKPAPSQQGANGPDAFDDDIPFAPLHYLA